jgi:hypothetical protein
MRTCAGTNYWRAETDMYMSQERGAYSLLMSSDCTLCLQVQFFCLLDQAIASDRIKHYATVTQSECLIGACMHAPRMLTVRESAPAGCLSI